jgi:HD-GYP domain-containing protein (c-di-GMP phosphodiesterase class II)/pSer/pThr/pTyr-binding forkhead associated (FHA) protein
MENRQISLRGLDARHEARAWQSAEGLRVGRLGTCEVALDDASVSRVHAEIVETKRGWVVRDLGSTNGTFLNGTRVGRLDAPVREGDILQFGEVCLVVAAARATPRPGGDGQRDWDVRSGGQPSLAEALRVLARERPQAAAALDTHLALVQAGRDAHSAQSLEGYLETVLWEAAEALDARCAAVALLDERTRALELRAGLDLEQQFGPEAWAEGWVGQLALARGQTVLLRRARGAPPPAAGADLQSILTAVLRSRGKPLGVLYLGRAPGPKAYGDADLALADALALALAPSVETVQHLFRRQDELFLQTLTTLSELVNLRTNVGAGHPQRVTDYCLLLAEELGLSPRDRHYLRIGAPLHDLGAVGVRDGILDKPAALTAQEVKEIRAHFVRGAALFESIPTLVPLVPIVRSHRERWDGSGYPDRLAGPQIPLLGRVVGLADAFDAMTTDRPYRRALPLDQALAEVGREAGTQFDPDCAAALLRLRPRIEELFSQRKQGTHTISRSTLEAVRQSLAAEKRGPAEAPSDTELPSTKLPAS